MTTPDHMVPVRVAYEVERTVYVYAQNDRQAASLARDTSNWVDEDDPHEKLDKITVKRR